MKKIISTIAIFFSIGPGVVFAQGNDAALMIAIFTVLGLAIIVLIAIVLSLQTLKKTLFNDPEKKLAEQGVEAEAYQS